MAVYGIGNPLIDLLCFVKDEDISALSLHKGSMNLIDEDKRKEIVEYIRKKEIIYLRWILP